MIRINYIPFWLTFFLIIGILLGYFTSPPIRWLFLVGLIIFIIILFFYHQNKKKLRPNINFTFSTFFLFILIGIISITIQTNSNNNNYFGKYLKDNNQIILQIEKALKPSNFYQKFEANILQINQQKVIGKVLLNIKRDSTQKNIKVDDIIFTSSEIKKNKAPLNPFQFDYGNYLHKQQIDYQLYTYDQDYLVLDRSIKTIKGLAFIIRDKINKKLINYNFTIDELAVINAILLGQRQDISKDLYKDYQRAGAVHILAVSGLHIGIILLILQFLLKPLERIKNGKIIKLIFLIILLWAYAFLAGFSASVIRAVSMFSAVAFGMFLGKSTQVKNSLVISMFFLLLFHSHFLFDVGFQLSYAAVFSIVIFQPEMSKIIIPKNKVFRYFWQIFTVTLAAQIGVLPLSLYYFHQFPGLFFISSLVIIPLLGIILAFGFIIIFLASFQILPQFVANIYNFVIHTLNNFVEFISLQENFIIQNIFFPLSYLIMMSLLIIVSYNFIRKRTFKSLKLLLIGLISFQIILIYQKWNVQNTNSLIVFHQNKSSLIAKISGNKIALYSCNTINKKQLHYHKNSIRNELGDVNITEHNAIKNIIKFNHEHYLIIDSSAIYLDLEFKPQKVILRQSPKINFERVLIKIKPNLVIIDGSNYKSYVKNWEKSAKILNVKLHYTSDKGAYFLDLN